MTAATVVGRAPSALVRIHWHHPEWVSVAVAAGGWLLLLRSSVGAPRHLLGGSARHDPAEAVAHAVVMTVAMMAPLVLPQVRHVATFSLWRRRYRAAGGFLVSYLASWSALGTALVLAGTAASSVAGRGATLLIVFGVAAVWAVAPRRRRRLQRCSATVPLRPKGWRADADCARYGMLTARSCMVTCGPLMAAVALQHGLVAMAGATALSLHERWAPDPDPRHVAAAVVGLGVFGSVFGLGPL